MNSFKFAVASDIHLGHPRTSTEHILSNLETAFKLNAELESLDVVFFSGDVFDRLLNFPDNNVTEIEQWVNQFLRHCKTLDIVVRVLEGTPSHDWKQSKIFEKINEIANIGCDVKHVTTLSIEKMERFNKTVLYVPDEWEPDPIDTWKQVKNLFSINNLEQVDFAIMHGSFPHQLPSHIKVPMHDPNLYQSIVKYIIVIGHIHKPSIHERIYTPGSFDRLSHGEEEPKGHLIFELKKDETWNVTFIENKNAKIYKTINCLGLAIEDALEKIYAVADKIPKESYLRIESNKDDPIMVSLDTLKNKYPFIIWDTKISTKDNKGREMLVDMRAKFQGIDITKNNIVQLLMDRIQTKINDKTLTNKCQSLLSEVIDNVGS
jgi:DNA repair exonuclease SbcCD nuclease subunit